MTAEGLNIETETILDKNVVLLTLTGALDAHTFDPFHTAIQDLFSRGHYRLVMNLAEIEYLSSAGVGVFFGALTEAREQHGNIVLMNISPSVLDVFNLLGLTQMFDIVSGRDAALAAFTA